MATFLQVKNRAVSTLAAGISDVDLSLTVAAGEGAKFPQPGNGFHITIDDEILKCTARAADVLTITRAQEGTAAAAHNIDAVVKLRITAKIISELQDALIAIDPDLDGVIALAQLDGAVCSETELATGISNHAGLPSVHHTKYSDAEAIAAAKTDTALKNPSGMIIMWHGTIVNIPSGWVLCDGGSGTPNLLAKFIEGVATAATNPGATGGSTSKSHASHSHTNPKTSGPSSTYALKRGTATSYATPVSSHTHTQGSTGSKTTSAHSDIRPLFYDIAFLMKT